ncbi:Ras association domain protein [Ostertagia ostertagi]
MMTVDAVSAKNSEYAQLSEFTSLDVPKSDIKRDDDTVSVAGTVFNEPWDSNVWENLLDLASHGDEGLSPRSRRLSDAIQEEDSDSDRTPAGSTRMHESEDELDDDMWASMTASSRRILPSDRVTCKAWENDDISFPRAISRYSHQIGSLDDLPLSLPALSPNLNSGRKTSQAESSAAIQSYVERLAEDESTVFGATLKRFIECTVQSEEADPSVVVRNVRQFINGIKNYLVKHGEGDLHGLIDQESSHLNANQILNIDAILEAVLHKLLLKRVKPHLYHVMVKDHSRAGGLQALSANIAYVRTLNLAELGFSDADQLVTPSASVMEQIKNCLRKMQHHYSPLKKLENLLRAISIVLGIQSKDDGKESQKIIAADAVLDLVRWLVYILARSSTVGCEVEAWYMWELLPQQMITKGDAAYYLTALFSAIHILKSIDAIKKLAEKDEDMVASMDLSRQFCSPSPSCASDAFVKVAIPDEVAGCIRYATFPGVPQMTTGKLCRVIAHQQGITNPEDHGLYLIVNGYESCLLPHECPDAIRDNLRGTGKPHLFAYKRHDAKIGWPRQVMSTPG